MSLSKPFSPLPRIRTYYKRVTAFSPNARKYLISIILYGSAMGVYRLLFNFYVLSLRYDEALLGNLITASSITALIVALPMGYLADILGRKLSLILGNTFVGIAVLMIVLFPSIPIFIAMNILMGIAQSLSGVTMGPFLMENSADEERTYLFSFSSGLRMTASSVGNWIGGYMPAWFGVWLGVNAVSAPAYAWSLGGIVGFYRPQPQADAAQYAPAH